MIGSRWYSFRALSPLIPVLLAGLTEPLAAQVSGDVEIEVAPAYAAPAAQAQPVPAGTQPAPAGQPMPGQPMPGQPMPGQPMPGQEAKPGEQTKPSEPPKSIQRQSKPQDPPDPAELQLQPDASGKLRFNFRGQPWPAVLDWLARVSKMSLDWTELPGDYLNLVTQRGYTVEEARDLINQHLLARGYTILRKGEVLSVRPTKNLDLSLVPRVDASELDERQPHEFVKITFKLDWLPADQAVTEFKPILSTNSTLVKLPATNRIEAADTVVNLRELNRLLIEEQSPQGQERLVQVFRLNHIRASIAHDLLKQFLELDKSGPAGPMTPEQQQQAAMLAAQAAAQAQAQPGQPPGGPGKEGRVSLIVHERENAILAHAPPDKMAIIAQTIKALDVEPDAADSFLRNIDRMQVFRLSTADPNTVVTVLKQIGNLAPDTRLEIDARSRSVIAYASLADRYTIQKLVEMLDGSTRKFEVVRLRRLKADFVVGTINYMMGVEEEEDSGPNRMPFYGYIFGGEFGMGAPPKEERKFRIDADVESNRLLLWANKMEMSEVHNLLVKLGEVPSRGSSGSTVRVIDTAPGPETEQMLDRIRSLWQGPNELIIEPAQPELDRPSAEEPQSPETVRPSRDATTSSLSPIRSTLGVTAAPHR